MSLFFSSLNSGSNGNCYYVGSHQEGVLVDVGISCSEVENRMMRVGLQINKLKAIFITHEHSDHIKGLAVLSKKYQLPVYITKSTLAHARLKLQKELVNHFSEDKPIEVGNLSVLPFSKLHDAADPHSFLVSCKGINVGVFTDLGSVCENLIKHFGQCHAAFLESNYDEEMLAKGNYPYYLKQRISGGLGHLSNRQALELYIKHRSPQMSYLILSHLSKNNNCPKVVQSIFEGHGDDVTKIVASRYEETILFEVRTNGVSAVTEKKITIKKIAKQTAQLRLSFE